MAKLNDTYIDGQLHVTDTVYGDVAGNLIGNVTGNVTGNADTATRVQKGLTVKLNSAEGTEYDGSVAVTINITPSSIGLGNVDNTTDMEKPVSTAQQAAIAAVNGALNNHTNNTLNPHNVTKAQVGLDKVNNTADEEKNVLTAQKFNTDRTISLSGDVTGSVTSNGLSGWSLDNTKVERIQNTAFTADQAANLAQFINSIEFVD